MKTLKIFFAALVASAAVPAASGYQCRSPDSALTSPQAVQDWSKTRYPHGYQNAPIAILIWDRFGPGALATLNDAQYNALVYCAKKGSHSDCQNRDRKIQNAVRKRQYDKLPARPPSSFLQVSGEYYGHCFGDRNGEVSLPASVYYTDNLTKAQCDAISDVYDDKNSSSSSTAAWGIEHMWATTYERVEKGKFATACKYIPLTLIQRHAEVFEAVRAGEADPEAFRAIAQQKQNSVCHPALDATLNKNVILANAIRDVSAEKMAAQLDPGDGSVSVLSVRTAFMLYAINNLGVERVIDELGRANVQNILQQVARCLAPEGGTPQFACGLPANPGLYARAQNYSMEIGYAKPQMELTLEPDFGPETRAFLAANLGSCVLEPGRLKSDADVAADAYAATQAPRPVEECWQVAGTIQSFIDNPGYSYSSSGMSYDRNATASDRDWLSRWKTKVAAGNPQCVADYPERILTLSKNIERQRQSNAAAEKRYHLSRANQGPSAGEIFQRWETMNSAYRRCIELYGDCRWVEN